MTEARKLGKALAAALEAGPSRSTLAAQRFQVLAAMQEASPSRSGRAWLGALALGSIALAGALALGLPRAWSEDFHGVWQGQTLSETSVVVGTRPAGEALEFSDGSRLLLEPQAELSLSKLGPEQARLELAQGGVEARIKKGTGRTWTIGAGPYTVKVVGTEFSVSWDRVGRAFEISVKEGKVLVFGGDLPERGVALIAGARLARRAPLGGAGEAGGARVASEAARTVAGAGAPVEPGAPREETTRAGDDATRRAPVEAAELDWRKLAASARYSQALQVAQREGFERLTREAPEKELLLLANTARYAGATSDARRALLKLRERFAGKPSAPLAALLLAGLAEDHAKNATEAISWLRVFLKESPKGELSAGARARLLALLVRQGERAEAQRVASDYLRYHPRGPYAAEARGVLGAAAGP